MSVRAFPVAAGDADWLAALHAQAFPDDPWSAAAFRALLDQPGVAGAGARDDDDALGLVLWRRAADEAEILTIAVRPDRRRRGIGGLLLDHALAVLAPDARALFLEVAADNVAARALYAAHGFAAVGRRAGYYRRAGRAIDALVLRRELPAAG